MFSGGTGNKTDQLLLVEFLTSIDMLNKLDSELDLRSHYSSENIDLISRLWKKDISIEWFYRYYLNRINVTYDDFSGVVKISAQAFDPDMAEKITSLLVQNGEEFMNSLSHKIADEQVAFLSEQVALAKKDLLDANEKLLNFQNRKNMVSPKAEVENHQELIAGLEKQKSDLLVKLSALPVNLGNNNQIKQTMLANIKAIDEQIQLLRKTVTNANDRVNALNELAHEENLLKLDVEFKKEIYASTLSGLAKGKLSAARMIKNVGILQSPSKPQYAIKPERLYCISATLVVMLLVLGMLQLLKAVILDHVD
jgi:capsular polysaccharide transport system permease protein